MVPGIRILGLMISCSRWHSRQTNKMMPLNSTSVYTVRTHYKNNNEPTKGRVVELDDGGSFATEAEVRPYRA